MSRLTASALFNAFKARRSIYALKAKSPISDAAITTIVQDALRYCPTPFNMQATRAVLVLGDKHRQLWDAMWEARKKALNGPEHIEAAVGKWNAAYRDGYGSVAFFDDMDVIKGYGKNAPDMAHIFPIWGHNSNGMLQFAVWNALELEGLGANLQHFPQFSPGCGDELSKVLDIPPNWEFSAVMPFGEIVTPAGEKTFQPIEARFKIVQ